jgi:hypothetical protein
VGGWGILCSRGTIVKGRTLPVVPAARKHDQKRNKRKSDPIGVTKKQTKIKAKLPLFLII